MTPWARRVWPTVWIAALLLVAAPGWAETVHYPAFLTLSGGATLNGVVYGNGTSSLLSTAQGPANSVLTANAGAPIFSATPQVTALGLGRAAPASGASIVSTGTLDWNGDVILQRETAPNTSFGAATPALSLRNGTADQAFRVYGTFTSPTNYAALEISTQNSSGDFRLGIVRQTVGVQNLVITASGGRLGLGESGGSERWSIDSSAALFPAAGNDNNTDLGKTALRIKTAWVGTAVRGGAAGVLDLGFASEGLKRLYCDFTNTATVGAVTINKACGRVNIAAAGTSVVVTDSLVTAASHVACWMSSADATGRVISCVPAAGSFTINTVATTGQASFDFQVFNAD